MNQKRKEFLLQKYSNSLKTKSNIDKFLNVCLVIIIGALIPTLVCSMAGISLALIKTPALISVLSLASLATTSLGHYIWEEIKTKSIEDELGLTGKQIEELIAERSREENTLNQSKESVENTVSGYTKVAETERQEEIVIKPEAKSLDSKDDMEM